MKNGMAILEEFLQEKYVENFDKFDENEPKIMAVQRLYPEYFYIPKNEGIGGLSYTINSNGDALYLIKKEDLPKDIKESLVGGDAGNKTYSDYQSLNDVYGVTSDLKVYYCSKGIDSIVGLAKEDLDKDNPNREVFNESSNLYSDVKSFDQNENGVITAEELKTIRVLTITENSNINDLKDIYNFTSLEQLIIQNKNMESLNGLEHCGNLYYIYLKSCQINNYSSLNSLKDRLRYLYLYDVDDSEISKLCENIKNNDYTKLNYFGIMGGDSTDWNNSNLGGVNRVFARTAEKTITTLEPLSKLSDITKKSVEFLFLNNNTIEDTEDCANVNYLKDFTNVYLLHIEGNKLKTLKGLESFSFLRYLYIASNKLGEGLDGDTENSEKDCLASLKNDTSLYLIRAENNTNLRWINYLSNCVEIRYLYLSGCSSLMSAGGISNIILNCGNNYSLPCKFLNGTKYLITDYYVANEATYQQLYSDLYENSTIKTLSLSGAIKLTDTELNTIICSMPQIENLNVSNTNLENLDFILEDKSSKLKEIWLDNTSVVDDIGKLEYAENICCGCISNSQIDLTQIQKTISRSSYIGQSIFNGNMWGFCIHNKNLIKDLSKCTNITKYEARETYFDEIIDVDLSSCIKLTYADLGLRNVRFKLPSGCRTVKLRTSCSLDLSCVNNIDKLELHALDLYAVWNPYDFLWKHVPENLTISWLQCDYLFDMNFPVDLSEKEIRVLKLNCASYNIGDRSMNLQNLGTLKGVVTLDLTMIKNEDLSIFSNFTELETLILRNCPSLTNIDNLNCSWIKNLTISNCSISGVKSLSNFKKLESLDLTNNLIYDNSSDSDGVVYSNLDILASLHPNYGGRLKKLYLEGNKNITDFSKVNTLSWDDESGF